MRLLICGDRNYTNLSLIRDKLNILPETTVVIHGGAKGADTLAGIAAHERKMSVEVFNAQWKVYGRAAGPIRNKQMIDEGQPDEVWAFHDDLENSKGTKDMLKQAQKNGIPTKVFSHNEKM